MTGLLRPLSARFHERLEHAVARVLRRIGPEELVMWTDGQGLAKLGIMIGSEFTDHRENRFP